MQLDKELSSLKEKTETLTQKLKDLESSFSSLFQRTITKDEMKDLLHDGITPIINILLSSNLFTVPTQPCNIIMNKITQIEEVLQSDDLDTLTGVYSLTETEDKRIASGGYDGNISISSYDISEKKWKRDIYKKTAHKSRVNSLCALNGNRLLSGSRDYSIKAWSVTDVDITLIKELKEHTNLVWKVIPLSKKRFASCSSDCTVRIWKDDNTYERVSTLKHNDSVISVLQLKGKDVLVSSLYGKNKASSGVTFWNVNNYTQQHHVEGYCVCWASHMIELSDGNVALSSGYEPYPIVVIDSATYQVKKEIQLKDCVAKCSSLCWFSHHSFIYACKGCLVQVSSEDCSVMFQAKGGRFNGCYGGVVPIDGGKYFAVENDKRISIIKFGCA